jgi:hypothetical protein
MKQKNSEWREAATMDRATVRHAKSRLLNTLQKWAEHNCPYVVGTVYDVPAEAFCHKDKTFVVNYVIAIEGFAASNFVWNITGQLLKRDGTVGLRHVQFKVPIQMED